MTGRTRTLPDRRESSALPLDLARVGPARERKAVASRNLATLCFGDRLPLELSGGEQQRVAIAIVIRRPQGRATRIPPGTALRYQRCTT
jgi:predicted ABC-type transport system involved in lysophospholipase L1 biosynthesis ATPase subunit